jgi:hypothetical protein
MSTTTAPMGTRTICQRGFSLLFDSVLLLMDAVTQAVERLEKVVHQYPQTSANDFPQRGPQDWRLLVFGDSQKRGWTKLKSL